ncbi:MAG TPA: UDP-N-acetylmuramate--L-alanine ligase [Amoebophilaceae bacterium]|jgi:UDP-N-acetylmuramate--alanine ligase|nr:UDP-N-acetylmuramate--L-alanine ligase [Amoebophilaceae bacterium]
MKQYPFAYFIGIGGIGMSALARLLAAKGCRVFGYDRTDADLVKTLRAEGITIHCEETIEAIPEAIRTHPTQTLVVYTPAIPDNSPLLVYCRKQGYALQTRAALLGAISNTLPTVAVAGTHGKTTTSALVAHLLHHSTLPMIAFVGGVVQGYETNLLHNCALDAVELMIAEADEFNRSFLHLHPTHSIVTSMDADHPETYVSLADMEASYLEFLRQTTQTIVVHHKVAERLQIDSDHPAACLTYGLHQGAVQATNIVADPRGSRFDCVTTDSCITHVQLPLPGLHNIENALAAIALCLTLGLSQTAIRSALAAFPGIKRRFSFVLETERLVCIDDYAHHPMEIRALVASVRTLYPHSHLTVLFQPHLFSRTYAYYQAFAEQLSLADRVLLLPIYPAREAPTPGVTAELILHALTCKQKALVTMAALEAQLTPLPEATHQVFLLVGAGDIGDAVGGIADLLRTLFR